MERLKTIIVFIFDYWVRVSLALVFVMVYAVSVSAQSNQGFLQKLIDGVFSGEVIALVLAGVTGFFLNRVRVESERRKEESIELGRLRFKQDNYEATKEAVREGLSGLQSQIQPRFNQIDDTLDDLRVRLERVEEKAEESSRRSEVLERTQRNWLDRAEEKISTILSAQSGHPTLIKNLFYEDPDEHDHGHDRKH